MRQIVLLTMLACALALGCAFGALASSASGDTTTTSDTTTEAASTASEWDHVTVQRAIDRYRHRTWHWQRVMGRRVTLTLRHPPTKPLVRIAVWKRIALHTKRIALHPPHMGAWLCIHRYEGAWNDPYGPYYGGLQMDLSFQSAYGRGLLARKGTADHWTPLEQMWVAERALQAGRGFSAWPNSARACGLL